MMLRGYQALLHGNKLMGSKYPVAFIFFDRQEARHEAFKFKVHIAREIELRGGVQKRRATPASTAARIATAVAKGNESFLDPPYVS